MSMPNLKSLFNKAYYLIRISKFYRLIFIDSIILKPTVTNNES